MPGVGDGGVDGEWSWRRLRAAYSMRLDRGKELKSLHHARIGAEHVEQSLAKSE
jgi:hypothetical protein